VSQGLETTFRFFAETPNEAASRVLIPALDSPFAAIRDRALELLLKRRGPAGHREIMARLHTFDEPWRRMVEEYHGWLTPALRDAVLSADQQVCLNGCRAAVRFREYDLIPALLTAMEDPSGVNAATASEALLDLVELLCEELTAAGEGQRRDAQLVRRRVVGALEASVGRFARHRRREVLDAFLLVTYRDDAVLRQVLQDPYHPAFVAIVEALSRIPHDALIGLLLGFLDDPRAPSAVLSVISKRSDPRFVRALLHKIDRKPSPAVCQNLKRMESVAWVRADAAFPDVLEGAEQRAAVRLAMMSGMPRAQVYPLVERLLLHGKPEGRRAAAEALDQFRGADANLLALEAVDDPDPQVQAKILVQLRGRGIPGALARLAEAIDSPHEVVHSAARASLAEFSFPRFLASFELLDEEVRATTAELVKKVDRQTPELLRAELTSPVRSRRLQGLAAARILDMAREVEDLVLPLLKDADHMLRAEAALSLGRCDSPAAREALVEAFRDRSPTVRDAARKGLLQQRQSSDRPGPPPQPANAQG